MAVVQLSCCICQVIFSRSESEANRSARLNRPVYCSRTCAGRGNIRNIPPETANTQPPPGGRGTDIYSPFRVCHRISRRRARLIGKEFDLQLEDLKTLWEAQNGICPYTGWKMHLQATTTEYNRTAKLHNPKRASLDRIDSSQGYVRENVQFVCHMANVAKNEYTHDQMIEFCRTIALRFARDDE